MANYKPYVCPAPAEAAGTRIAIHLAAGRWEIAHRVIEDYRREVEEAAGDWRAMPLAMGGVSVRTVAILNGQGIRTLGQIEEMSDLDLLGLSQFGISALRECRRSVGKFLEDGDDGTLPRTDAKAIRRAESDCAEQ